MASINDGARAGETRNAETREFETRNFETRAQDMSRNRFYGASVVATQAGGFPTPPHDKNYAYKWMRISIGGTTDDKNISDHFFPHTKKLQWELVPPKDMPDFAHLSNAQQKNRHLSQPAIVLSDSALVRTKVQDYFDFHAAARQFSRDQLQSREGEARGKYSRKNLGADAISSIEVLEDVSLGGFPESTSDVQF